MKTAGGIEREGRNGGSVPIRPEDLVKRNMFAIEGRSIKFPLKVSTLFVPPQRLYLLRAGVSCKQHGLLIFLISKSFLLCSKADVSPR